MNEQGQMWALELYLVLEEVITEHTYFSHDEKKKEVTLLKEG